MGSMRAFVTLALDSQLSANSGRHGHQSPCEMRRLGNAPVSQLPGGWPRQHKFIPAVFPVRILAPAMAAAGPLSVSTQS